MIPTLKKILCVEDEEDIRLILQLALEDVGGFDVAIYDSGKKALKAVESFRPDLILLDVMMPEMDGFATLNALQQLPIAHNIPVVFLTARAQASEIENYKKLKGIVDVIVKPFDPVALADNIKQLWKNQINPKERNHET